MNKKVIKLLIIPNTIKLYVYSNKLDHLFKIYHLIKIYYIIKVL
jgi:hypothetical protein